MAGAAAIADPPWLTVAEAAEDIAKTGPPKNIDALYKERIKTFLLETGCYPKIREDQNWRSQQQISRECMRKLRHDHLPKNVQRGGAPTKN